jgi:hypothetical protein
MKSEGQVSYKDQIETALITCLTPEERFSPYRYLYAGAMLTFYEQRDHLKEHFSGEELDKRIKVLEEKTQKVKEKIAEDFKEIAKDWPWTKPDKVWEAKADGENLLMPLYTEPIRPREIPVKDILFLGFEFSQTFGNNFPQWKIYLDILSDDGIRSVRSADVSEDSVRQIQDYLKDHGFRHFVDTDKQDWKQVSYIQARPYCRKGHKVYTKINDGWELVGNLSGSGKILLFDNLCKDLLVDGVGDL